ncbi:HNH endonuclease [Deinococcus sp.]|uniref:HNH endonuclease n=1 Tax=Deinococcus sp. TaxID=47478 RepID=UPI0025C16E7F|nr:HNH endonuclease [Deinococcus sp.]
MVRRRPESAWPFSAQAAAPVCALCERQTPLLTEHHLVPRSQGRRRGVKVSELPTVMLCPACHKFLHATLTNAQLANEFPDLERLRQHEDVRKFLHWLRKQPATKAVRIRRGR